MGFDTGLALPAMSIRGELQALVVNLGPKV